MRGSWLLGVGLAATLFAASDARALTCAPPPSLLLWSYPDATIEVVPTDAVFRAYAPASFNTLLVFELDGRELPSSAAELEVDVTAYLEGSSGDPRDLDLARHFEYPRESAEFVPPEPLSPGEHQVVISIFGYVEPGSYELRETQRFTVRAEEQPRSASDVTISAVTLYGANYQIGERTAPEAFDGACEIISSAVACPDAFGYWGPPGPEVLENPATRVEIPRAVGFTTRIDLAANEPALGYVIGSQFVPASCAAIVGGDTAVPLDENASAFAYYAQAVLPTGLGEPHGFTGEPSIVPGIVPPRPPADAYPQSTSSLCSLGAVGTRASGSDFALLAVFVAGAAGLRRSRRVAVRPCSNRARQFPPCA